MITLSILILLAVALIITIVAAVGTGAIALILACGDVIVCCLLIWFIIKLFRKKKD